MSRSSKQHTLISILLVAIALCMVWLAQHVGFSVDVTANKRHQLTSETVQAVKSLRGPVDITAVLGPTAAQRQTLDELVSRYQLHNPLISLSYLNPETDPARVRALKASASGELIIQGMGREQRLSSVSERSLTGALRQLNRAGERRLVFIEGHEERAPDGNTSADWLAISQRLQRIGLNTETRSLVTDPRIEDAVDVLVIADPTRPYFPGEIASLLEYVNRGGNLLWMIDTSTNQGGPQLKALALELGIDTASGVVIDTASQSANTGSATFVIINQLAKHPVNAGITSPVLLPQASALDITPLAAQTLLPLLTTPESSWTENGALEGAVQFDPDTSEQRGPLILGVTIERQIGERQQRIAVIGDADFGSNQFVGIGANQTFIESLFLWLSGDSDELQFVSEAAPDSQLILDSQSIVVLSVVLLLVLPLLFVIIAGWLRWRRNR